MIVVSDTSPLNYLVLIEAIDVLPRLFGRVHVPTGVIQELQHPRTPESVRRWIQSPPEWLYIESPTVGPSPDTSLDPGEAEAIALALQLGASAILIDEKKGRRIAKQQGLATLGTITVLELAAEQNLIDLKNAFAALQETSFHCAQALLDAAIKRADARKPAQGQ